MPDVSNSTWFRGTLKKTATQEHGYRHIYIHAVSNLHETRYHFEAMALLPREHVFNYKTDTARAQDSAFWIPHKTLNQIYLDALSANEHVFAHWISKLRLKNCNTKKDCNAKKWISAPEFPDETCYPTDADALQKANAWLRSAQCSAAFRWVHDNWGPRHLCEPKQSQASKQQIHG